MTELEQIAVLVTAFGGAAAVGALIALAVFVTTLVRGFGRTSVVIDPTAVRAARVRRHPTPVGGFEPDLAWPIYFWRQVHADRAQVARLAQACFQVLLQAWIGTFLRGRHGDVRRWWIVLPVPVLTLAVVVSAGLLLVVGNLLFALLVWGSTAVALAGVGLAVGGQRLAEFSWDRIRGADASCPKCYHVSDRPAYRCPGCSALHRDIRPGLLGIFARRCDCGALLPTTVVRAAWRLTAVCQRCQEPLRLGAAAVRDVRIPIFGDVSAGKTRYLYAALDSLIVEGRRAGLAIDFPDEESRVQGERALALIRSGRDTDKTSEALPRALSCRIGRGPTGALLHLFDAAGERFRSAVGHDELSFLATAHGLVYVIDPFAVGMVRDRLRGNPGAEPNLARAAGGDPESAYGEVVSRLRGGGIKPQSQRLAVIVSRADLLAGLAVELPSGSDQVAEWLYEMGLHNLVLAAKQEFAEVRYYAVASLTTSGTTPSNDPGVALRWLLSSRGVRLPDRADPVPAGEVA